MQSEEAQKFIAKAREKGLAWSHCWDGQIEVLTVIDRVPAPQPVVRVFRAGKLVESRFHSVQKP